MEIRRFYVDKSDIDGDIVTISGEEFKHMTKVLRHKVGFKIIVNNNCDGIDYYARIKAIEGGCARAEIYGKEPNECKCETDVTLYQACPKPDKLDIIAQKASELGVNTVRIFTSEYSEKGGVKIDRLQRIVIEACKQCGRSRVPVIEGVLSFGEMLDGISDGFTVLFNEHEREKGYSSIDLSGVKGGKINLIVGAEGGFSLDEVDKIGGQAVSVSLGKRILRCETAAIMAAALTMYKLGEIECGEQKTVTE